MDLAPGSGGATMCPPNPPPPGQPGVPGCVYPPADGGFMGTGGMGMGMNGTGGVTVPPRDQPALPTPPTAPAGRSASALAPSGFGGCAIANLNKLSIAPSATTPSITVTGAAGAVPANAYVYVQSVPTGVALSIRAGADGSFTTPIEGTDGSTIVVNCGTAPGASWQNGGAALFLTKPTTVTSPSAIPVGVSGPGIDAIGEYWVGRGNVSGWSFRAGETVTYDMAFTYYSSRVTATTSLTALTSDMSTQPNAGLIRLADATGQPVQANFIPVLLTPTGLPIFDRAEVQNDGWRFQAQLLSSSATTGAFTANYRLTLRLPSTMPGGHYVPAFGWTPNGVFGNTMTGPPQGSPRYQQGVTSRNLGPVVQVGDPSPARVPWVLLGNQLDNGNRGVVAREDRGKFEFGHKVTYNADRLVIPKTNTQGQPISYRLEPYLPTISHQIGGPNRPVPPLVTFVFPDGQLQVQVKRPDGQIDDLGTAPFRAGRAQGTNESFFGPTSVNDVYELTTFDPGFDYTFAGYGHYEVTMSGWARDAIGNVYGGGGTYDVWVAEALDIDLGTFPSTPFQVGDTMSPTVHVNPPVPAAVSLTLKVFPNSSTANVVTKNLTGTANAYGYFHPGTAATRLSLDSPGEYLLDVLVSYTDTQGRLWMGAQRAASVIETPNVPFTVHGKRGITHGSGHFSSAWFRVKDIISPGQNDEQGLGSPVLMPYHSGDVIWSADDSDSGIFPAVTIQDDQRITSLATGLPDSEITAGEIDVTMPSIRPDGIQSVQAPDRITTWAYSYFSAMRAGVTIRSMVGSGEVQRAYWQFGDRYNDQLGNGQTGDRVDDAKLQYAGVVYRDTTANKNYYAIYGSMAAMIPLGTTVGQRVFPPFQGNGGGPTGGPLISMAGQSIDMFFTPVGVMPGTVLTVGDTVSVSGVVWPTLASKVDVVVVKPSGAQVAFNGRANKVGAFYRPGDDFVADQAGMYTAQIAVTHDGRTSAGQCTAPYPTGGVLGTTDGLYRFYVASAESVTTPLTIAASSTTLGAQGVTFTVTPPAGVTPVDARVTANLTGTVLDDRALTLNNGAYTFTYAPANYSTGFHNLDPDGADTVDVTFYVRGTTTGGAPVHLVKRVLFVAGRLWMVQ